MKASLLTSKLSVKKSPIHGYGVFADQDFAPGDLIEESCALSAPAGTAIFNDFYFSATNKSLLALGHGSLFNHSDDPNAHYTYDKEHECIVFKAIKPIRCGEEILIYYGAHWFLERKIQKRDPSGWYRLRKRGAVILTRFLIVLGLILFVCKLPAVITF